MTVAALAESPWVLAVAWVFGGLGMVMGVAGFAGWGLHPDFLAKFLSGSVYLCRRTGRVW